MVGSVGLFSFYLHGSSFVVVYLFLMLLCTSYLCCFLLLSFSVQSSLPLFLSLVCFPVSFILLSHTGSLCIRLHVVQVEWFIQILQFCLCFHVGFVHALFLEQHWLVSSVSLLLGL